MAIFKCKMCGGSLEVATGTSVIECEYCGTQQTLPKVDDERLANLHGRANHFRRNSEYDKAMGIYEQILSEDSTDAEAYWSLVLCRYGIEYVEDPATHKRVPTINRAQFTAVYDDSNYKAALKNADTYQKALYEKEAKVINDIQKGILEISQKEEPFDVFICYKESDAAGKRTPDSVLANDLYYQLTQEGFKVFFARITLEDKLGSAYEPYIFAALNSAKVMVVLGTKPEYFNAIWVKNEWSRFLGLIKQGQDKILIPAYKGMDAYDLPEEFAHLQAQDMTKLGFMQDLIRGIKKITQADESKVALVVEKEASANSTVAPLLERAFMFLEDEDWESADVYCEKVLDQEPKNAEAYLGKLMANLQVKKRDDLKKQKESFEQNANYKKAYKFADKSLRDILEGYTDYINARKRKSMEMAAIREAKKEANREASKLYKELVNNMEFANTSMALKNTSEGFEKINFYKDSKEMAQKCMDKAREIENLERDCGILIKEFQEFNIKRTEGEQKAKKIEARIGKLEKDTNELLSLSKHFGKLEETIEKGTEKINFLQIEIANLQKQREGLGLFAIRKKKELDETVITLQGKIHNLVNDVQEANNNKQGYASLQSVLDKIETYQKEIKEKKEILDELSNQFSSEEIQQRLNENALGKALLEFYEKNPNILSKVKKGDTIKIGKLTQKGRMEAVDLTWEVIDIQNGKLLLITKYVQDYREFGREYNKLSPTWRESDLRCWVNTKFYSKVFSDGEKALIKEVLVPDEDTDGLENNAIDKLFCLSASECESLFELAKQRKCNAIPNTENTATYGYTSAWWLRSNSKDKRNVNYVTKNGDVSKDGLKCYMKCGIRPAMWIYIGK